MTKEELNMKSEDKKDIFSKTKTIYDAGYGEIFFKNFLAGLGRGLGGVFIYIIFIIILSLVFYNFVLPRFMPLITGYMNIFKSLESISNIKSGESNIIPENLNILKLLGQ